VQNWNSPTVANGILYYATDQGLQAVRLSDKKQLWQVQGLPGQSMDQIQVKNGAIYIQIMQMHTGAGTDGIVLTVDAKSGRKLWQSSSMPTGVREMSISSNTIYCASIGRLDAFDIHSGRLLWRQNLDTGKILIEGDTLYLGLLTQQEGVTGLDAVKASSGQVLWQKDLAWQIGDSPLGLQNGVIYTASNNGHDGGLDAFDAGGGSLLWHMPVSGSYAQWQVAFG
jgi:outer membrane protein assembly factor BamB